MPATNREILVQEFEYKPGFQVGFGWTGALDNWVLYGEYTRLHGSTHTSEEAPDPGATSVNGLPLPQKGVWIPTSWLPGVFVNNITPHISSKWTYKIDILDGQISRPFYSGTRFILEPFFGLRAAWISQKMRLRARNLSTTVFVPIFGDLTEETVAFPTTFRTAHYNSHSWGVGPRVGLDGEWHLGYGIRFIGDVSASLLFTQYDVTQNVESPDVADPFVLPILGPLPINPLPLRLKLDDYNTLRPNLELSLGLGWGSYFRCRRYHWDLAATYDFSIFWEQNMMRYLADIMADFTAHVDGAASNLFLHGLTIKTRFDF